MSGHSKWATIKHKKAALDAKRGRAFTRLTKEITVAARVGGGQTASNPRLRQLIDKARAINMPMDTITRAIKKGTGELPGVSYEEHTYEGYGPAGIAVIVETLSDNKNRTVADMRRLFTSNNGTLAENGAVSWMFKKLGVVRAKSSGEKTITEDELLEHLIDFDIKDITEDESLFEIVCEPKMLDAVKNKVESLAMTVESAELEWVPETKMPLDGSQEEKALEFLDKLEDQEDVQNVYTNLA